MYLSATNEKIQVVLSGSVNTNQLQFTTSYQDITSAGMTLPQASSQGLTNNTTDVDMVAAPSASTTRQVMAISVYNSDVATAEVTIKKDVAGTEYILTKQILSPTDTLYYTWGGGWSILSGSGTNESITFSVFTANGTYTKPAGLKYAHIFCIGGGGGGASGRRGATLTNRYGGGSGSGAAIVSMMLPASIISSSNTVTIGAGGTGGAAITTDDTNGNGGSAGGNTLFGGIIVAAGGNGGGAGTAVSGPGANAVSPASCSPAYGPYAVGSNTGSAGSNTNASAGTHGFGNSTLATGGSNGGGGGGLNTSNTVGNGGNGGGVYQNGVLIAGPASSAASLNGADNQSVYLHNNQTLTSGYGLGTGGAGGTPTAGKYDGGNGGNYGAAGGGGAGSLNGTNSGKGGNGAGGLCVVMNVF